LAQRLDSTLQGILCFRELLLNFCSGLVPTSWCKSFFDKLKKILGETASKEFSYLWK
jgi:hypothetical protein